MQALKSGCVFVMKLFSPVHQTGEEEGKEKHHFVPLSLGDKMKMLYINIFSNDLY